jgi:hypothetical protein
MRLFFDDALSSPIRNAEIMPAFLASNRRNFRVPVDGGLEAVLEVVQWFPLQLALGKIACPLTSELVTSNHRCLPRKTGHVLLT